MIAAVIRIALTALASFRAWHSAGHQTDCAEEMVEVAPDHSPVMASADPLSILQAQDSVHSRLKAALSRPVLALV
jgi:hypothetical protein